MCNLISSHSSLITDVETVINFFQASYLERLCLGSLLKEYNASFRYFNICTVLPESKLLLSSEIEQSVQSLVVFLDIPSFPRVYKPEEMIDFFFPLSSTSIQYNERLFALTSVYDFLKAWRNINTSGHVFIPVFSPSSPEVILSLGENLLNVFEEKLN